MQQGAPRRAAGRVWSVQLALVALATCVMLAPPANGTIAIMPALPGDAATTFHWALAADAVPIAPGPYAGAFVVQGKLASLLLPAIAHGAFLLAARPSGCGPNPLRKTDAVD